MYEPFYLSMCAMTEPADVVKSGEVTTFTAHTDGSVTYYISLEKFVMTVTDPSATSCPDFTVSIPSGALSVSFTVGATYDQLSLTTDINSPIGTHTITYDVTVTGQTYTTSKQFTITIVGDCSTLLGSELDIENSGIWLTGASTAVTIDAGELKSEIVITSSSTSEVFTVDGGRMNAYCDTNYPLTYSTGDLSAGTGFTFTAASATITVDYSVLFASLTDHENFL